MEQSNHMSSYHKLVLLFVIISLIGIVSSYSAPIYSNVDLQSGNYYTAPTYTNVPLVLGEGAANPCDYVSGNWNPPCSCIITSPINLNGNNFTINGTGTFILTADVSNYIHGIISGGCLVRCDGGCFK